MIACVLWCLSAASAAPVIEQVTHGPAHHFFGYIGHVGNTPWNASSKYMVLLRTTFQDRMPEPGEAADIVLLDTRNGYKAKKIEESRAWNPQQGTMLYWNPEAPETQFFFNDRDPESHKVFCVLYDIEAGGRIKEYRFEDTPIGNSGVAQQGGYFLGLNYGRMDRLRKVTGYAGAHDWTNDDVQPHDDGIFKVDVTTGEKALLVSFAALADQVRSLRPDVDEIPLFINHTLWSRDDERILFYLRGHWNVPAPRINEFFTMHADGSMLTRHETFLGGHPEWAPEHRIIGTAKDKQVIYDVDGQRIVRELGDERVFPNPEGDIALSPDGRWFVNGYKRGDENVYTIYDMELGAHETVPGLKRGTQFEGDVRLDPSPCWRRDVKALAVPGIAPDGTRQTFVIHLEDFAEAREARAKPRVIVTTDGEGDDQCSMVRFLLYANEWDLQGIVFSSSKHHWLGDGATPGYKWLGMEWLDEQLAAYAEVYPNLTLHDAGYPTPDYVKSQVYVGNILLEGDMREPTPGSDHIARVLLQPETSPVWLQAWGGPNTIARALKTIQEEHPERMAEVARKARIFLVAQQDSTFQDYIQKEWPGITTLGSTYDSYGAISYRWHEFQSPEILPYFEPEWLLPNILQGHGPLGARYILKKGKYRSEGDSVAFLHLIDTGLRSAENPAWGGWGGRFAIEEGAYWKSADKQGMPPHSILRWAIDFQNDWAARADWCVKPFEDANHPPEVVLDHSADLFAAPGERVTLRATNTRDPDGNALQFRWWQHVEAGTHAGPVEIQEPNRPECQVLMPSDVAPGDTIHLICAVTDDGTPPLSRYARVIITGANSTQE